MCGSDRDMALEDVPAYDPDKAEGTPSTSLVLSGSELITMNDSQWKQVLAVSCLLSQLPLSSLIDG